MSSNYIIKIICLKCNIIAICDTLYEYELIRSQLWTSRFLSPSASESAHRYTHRVSNCFIIAANARTGNFTMLYLSQMYSILQLRCFAINWTESILHHLGHKNRESHSPQTKKVWSTLGLTRISSFGRQRTDWFSIAYWHISYMTLHITRCHHVLMLTTTHLSRSIPQEHESTVVCLVTRNNVSCW
jgi:hypothetical protein